MKTILLLLAIIIGGYYGYVTQHSGPVSHVATTAEQLQPQYQETTDKIEAFLVKKNSPLAAYAKDFAEAADAYRLPPELIVGITYQESSLGKRYPKQTNNPWNYGFCDSCPIGRSFPTMRDGAYTVARAIATGKYYRKYQKSKDLNDLAAIYLTGDRAKWVAGIEYVGKEIE